MGWVRERSHRKPSTAGVRMALRKIGKNSEGEAKLKVVFTFGPDALTAMGWKKGDQVEVLRGTEGDAGKVRIKRGNVEAYRLRIFAGSGEHKNQDKLMIAVWKWDGLPETKRPVTEVAWRKVQTAPIAEGIALELDLPKWALPARGFEDADAGDVVKVRRATRAA